MEGVAAGLSRAANLLTALTLTGNPLFEAHCQALAAAPQRQAALASAALAMVEAAADLALAQLGGSGGETAASGGCAEQLLGVVQSGLRAVVLSGAFPDAPEALRAADDNSGVARTLRAVSKVLRLLAAAPAEVLSDSPLPAACWSALRLAEWCTAVPPGALHATLEAVLAAAAVLRRCRSCPNVSDDAFCSVAGRATSLIRLAATPARHKLADARQAAACCAAAEAGVRLLPLLLSPECVRRADRVAPRLAEDCLSALQAHLDTLHAFLHSPAGSRGSGADGAARAAAAAALAEPLWGLHTATCQLLRYLGDAPGHGLTWSAEDVGFQAAMANRRAFSLAAAAGGAALELAGGRSSADAAAVALRRHAAAARVSVCLQLTPAVWMYMPDHHCALPPLPLPCRRRLQAVCMAQAEVMSLRQRRLALPLAAMRLGAYRELLPILAELPHGQLDPALLAAFEACAREQWQVRRGASLTWVGSPGPAAIACLPAGWAARCRAGALQAASSPACAPQAMAAFGVSPVCELASEALLAFRGAPGMLRLLCSGLLADAVAAVEAAAGGQGLEGGTELPPAVSRQCRGRCLVGIARRRLASSARLQAGSCMLSLAAVRDCRAPYPTPCRRAACWASCGPWATPCCGPAGAWPCHSPAQRLAAAVQAARMPQMRSWRMRCSA